MERARKALVFGNIRPQDLGFGSFWDRTLIIERGREISWRGMDGRGQKREDWTASARVPHGLGVKGGIINFLRRSREA